MIISLNLLGQSKKFSFGHIIHKNGSIEQGYIKDRGFDIQYLSITFKKKSGEVVDLEPNDISGYSVRGKKFISGKLQHETGSEFLYFFFELLTSGTHQLLKLYLDENSANAWPTYLQYESTHFFLKSNSGQIQLTRDNFRNEIEEKTECNNMVQDGTYDYTSQGIVSFLLEKEKVCESIDIKQEIRPKERTGIESFGIGGGVTWAKIIPGHPHFENVEFTSNTGVSMFAFMQIPFNKRFSIRGGLFYMNKKTTGNETVLVNQFYENVGESLKLKTEINFKHIGILADLKYAIKTEFLTPYVFLGVNFGVSSNNEVHTELLVYLMKMDYPINEFQAFSYLMPNPTIMT